MDVQVRGRNNLVNCSALRCERSIVNEIHVLDATCWVITWPAAPLQAAAKAARHATFAW